jgi:hypothetical protein
MMAAGKVVKVHTKKRTEGRKKKTKEERARFGSSADRHRRLHDVGTSDLVTTHIPRLELARNLV